VDKQCFFLLAGETDTSSGISISGAFNIFDDPQVRKLADLRIKLDELVVEIYPHLVKSLINLGPEFSKLVLPGDFVILSNKHVNHLAREAALSHLLRQLFPKVYGLTGKSTILKKLTAE
jgi:hypothetical protein